MNLGKYLQVEHWLSQECVHSTFTDSGKKSESKTGLTQEQRIVVLGVSSVFRRIIGLKMWVSGLAAGLRSGSSQRQTV